MSELESSALKEFKKTIRSIRSSSDYPRSITAVKKKNGIARLHKGGRNRGSIDSCD